MTNRFLHLALLPFLFSAALTFAQSDAPPPSNTPPPHARLEPCWRQAGISQPVMEQRREIERDVHTRVAAICENSSLTPQQKQQQAREIRQQAEQKVNALITPEQQNTLHACQQQRPGNRMRDEGHAAGGGPCGNFAGRQSPANGNSGGTPQTPQN